MGRIAALVAVAFVLGSAAPATAAVRLSRPLLSADGKALTVRVTTPGHALRVTARPRGVARAVRLRSGSRRARLPLTARGRRLVARCDLRRVVLTAGGARAVLRGRCAAADGVGGPGCDPFDPSACLLPFPNDRFTRRDPSTPTGRRLDLPLLGMPRNVLGKPIDPSEYNRNDGFSPGSPILVNVPGLDAERSGIVPQTDMARAFDPGQPAVVIDAHSGERQLIWGELDVTAPRPSERVLILRPGRNLREGRRYVVALRDLRTADGTAIAPQPAFRMYRDRLGTLDRSFERRRPHMERLFDELEAAGIARESLVVAWDFTVASTRDRTGRALHLRDTAFAELGDEDLADLEVEGRSPGFEVSSAAADGDDPRIARVVEGTVTVPCFLDQMGCGPGSTFAYTSPRSTVPQRLPGNTMQANFRCIVPQRAVDEGGARVSLYGHGLFGSRAEVRQGQLRDMAHEHKMVFCATDWIGMSTDGGPLGLEAYGDLPFVGGALVDLSRFPVLADRVQQGLLNFMFLGRAMIHPDGFGRAAAFQDGAGRSVLDTTRLYYDGNSQGGIIGGALMALTPDAERGVLGVPGMNYSTLLNRSVDFESDPAEPCPPLAPGALEPGDLDPTDPESLLDLLNFSYACPLYLAYPQHEERQLVFALMQQLWDRAEANGYALHMTDRPLPNTPPHEVLMHVGLGDHQVAQVSAEVEARTIGAAARPNPVEPGRSTDVEPLYGIPRIGAYPYRGSVYELWDSGRTPPAPAANVPPREGEDPHEEPRNTVAARLQKDAFLRPDGVVIDPCGGAPCRSRARP